MTQKGVTMVVMDKQDYNSKVHDLLKNQDINKPILKDPIPKLKNQLTCVLKDCKT